MEESLIENNNQIAEVFSASTLRAIVSFINDNSKGLLQLKLIVNRILILFV